MLPMLTVQWTCLRWDFSMHFQLYWSRIHQVVSFHQGCIGSNRYYNVSQTWRYKVPYASEEKWGYHSAIVKYKKYLWSIGYAPRFLGQDTFNSQHFLELRIQEEIHFWQIYPATQAIVKLYSTQCSSTQWKWYYVVKIFKNC